MDERSFLRTCSVGGIAGLTLAVGLIWYVPAAASVIPLLVAGGGGGGGESGSFHPGGPGQITTSGQTGLASSTDGGGSGGTAGGGGGGGFYIGGGNGGGGAGWLQNGGHGNGGSINGVFTPGGPGGLSYPTFAGGLGVTGSSGVSGSGGFGGGGAGGPGGAGGGGGGYSGGGGGSAQYKNSSGVVLSQAGGGGGSYVESQFTGVTMTAGANGTPNGGDLPGYDGFVEIETGGVTTTISYSGGVVLFTTATTGHYWIEAAGAQGGPVNSIGAINGEGGFGAEVSGYIDLSAGFVLDIAVGGQGGYGFGGGGGGGGTFVWAATTVPIIPEPSTWAMILLGFAGLGYAVHRSSKQTIGI
jgi:hypothetical protein